MPIIPYITDNHENVNSLLCNAKQADVHYVLPGTLYLRGKTKIVFFEFVKSQFPNLYDKILNLYKSGAASKEYKNNLYKMLNNLRNHYNLSNSYSKPMKEKINKQISLFS